MANAAKSQATGPLFFLKTGCPNEILVASGNRATANFEHCPVYESKVSLKYPNGLLFWNVHYNLYYNKYIIFIIL